MYSEPNKDSRKKAFIPSIKCTVTYVDVAATMRTIQQMQGISGDLALDMGETLAGAALLGQELSRDGESIILRLKEETTGNQVAAEAVFGGGLRAVAKADALDKDASFLGGTETPSRGSMEIVRAMPGRILSSTSCDISPLSPVEAMETYWHRSLQRMGLVEVQSNGPQGGDYIESASGLLVECLPDGDFEAFDQIRQLFDDDTVANALADGISFPELLGALHLNDAKFSKPEPLFFSCNCSGERVKEMLAGLPASELEAMADKGVPAEIACRLCGRRYSISKETLRSLAKGKGE